ncbi:MAG: phosphopantothenoylcysteine decarboxylase [Deltaproteobacteria bacterium GWC2_42_11]|nr:MAG: phosphopantothenoylcysteine decarboxylase [Deltaproteobacteria bacterium GWC2_42_11]HBO84984.1 bifunctional phosphopantothenoylcysteine decarboxylase/phosphopantothenate--cysteine ligase CoaBC [Deltaproteobacteria bacterium]
MLKDKNIVLGITGGIAAYKALELTRLLVKKGANVYPVMTKSAAEFIAPLSFQTLSGNPVYTELFDISKDASIRHIDIAEKADIIIIAPATANVIGKVANGIADDLLTTIIMASKCPKLFAPAMNVNMYENPIVQKNISRLKRVGYFFVGPDEGELACGYEGKGRLAPLEDIIYAAEECLSPKDMKGEKVLVTAGPTREPIDPVRFISNSSSGKMGYAIAKAAKRRGAEVVLVSGPSYLKPPSCITFVSVATADEMSDAAMRHYPQSTVVIMAAAVSDYKPMISHRKKVKKDEAKLAIEIERTGDILQEMGNQKRRQFLVGFALETDDIIVNAKKKLKTKNLDLVVANSTEGFSSDVNQVAIIHSTGEVAELPKLSKDEVAERILDVIVKEIGK